MLTRAWLGNNATASATRCSANGSCGAITITADGEDTNQASATAGSGGVAAGDAAVGNLRQFQRHRRHRQRRQCNGRSDADGRPAPRPGDRHLAAHTATYGAAANSVNAAVVGGSGSQAITTVDFNVASSLGDNDRLEATGPTAAGIPGIALIAQNNYDEELPSGKSYSAEGGAGGVLNGAASLSTIKLLGNTSVTTGNSVQLSSGSDPVDNPGGILFSASTTVTGSDAVTMTTGGVFEGSGNNDLLATSDSSHSNGLSNTAAIGANNILASDGAIGIGTYTLAQASTNAYSASYGGVGVADALADTSVTTTQTVTIGADTTISAFGNINLTAGQDPTGAFANSFDVETVAQGYVRGLIAIPAASATSNLRSNASVAIGSGDQILSAQNVSIGAYKGTKSLTADGTGHGYELGFIPVTNHDSDTNDNSSPTVATIDGTVVAGYYYNLSITIANCQDSGIFCSSFTEAAPTATGGGIPLGSPSQYWMASFNPQTFITDNAASAGGGATLAADNSSNAPVGVFGVPDIVRQRRRSDDRCRPAHPDYDRLGDGEWRPEHHDREREPGLPGVRRRADPTRSAGRSCSPVRPGRIRPRAPGSA